MPVVRPVKTQVVEDPMSEVEQAAGGPTAGDDVTVKPVRTEPPLLAGATQVMVAVVADAVATAVTPVGALGLPMVMEGDGADAGPFPLAFLAVTVKV